MRAQSPSYTASHGIRRKQRYIKIKIKNPEEKVDRIIYEKLASNKPS